MEAPGLANLLQDPESRSYGAGALGDLEEPACHLGAEVGAKMAQDISGGNALAATSR